MRWIRPITVVAATAALTLAGCASEDGSTDDPSASAAQTAETLPPIEIDGPSPVEAKVGDFLNVTTAGVVSVGTDNAEVLEVSQPRDEGSAQFNAGAEVVGPGTAVLTVRGENEDLYQVQITAVAE